MHSLLIARNDLKAQNVAGALNCKLPQVFKVIAFDVAVKVESESTIYDSSAGTREACCSRASAANRHLPLKTDSYAIGRMIADILLEMNRSDNDLRALASGPSLDSVASVIPAIRPLLTRPEIRGNPAQALEALMMDRTSSTGNPAMFVVCF